MIVIFAERLRMMCKRMILSLSKIPSGWKIVAQVHIRYTKTLQPTSDVKSQWCRSWGWKRTLKSFGSSKIRAKYLKIRAQMLRHFYSICVINKTDWFKNVWIWLFSPKKVFFVWPLKRSSCFCESFCREKLVAQKFFWKVWGNWHKNPLHPQNLPAPTPMSRVA